MGSVPLFPLFYFLLYFPTGISYFDVIARSPPILSGDDVAISDILVYIKARDCFASLAMTIL